MVIHSAQAMRAQVIASFIQLYFSSTSLSSSTNFDDSIFRGIGSLAQKSQMTDRALSAMSCIYLGKANHNTSILNHGLSLYHTAIRQVSSMINRGIYTHDIYYTIFLFQEIDVMHAPCGLSSWGTHIAGVNTLLQCPKLKSSRADDPIISIIYHHWQKLQIVFASTGMRLSKLEHDYLMEPTNGDPLLEIIQINVAIGDLEDLLVLMDSSDPDLIACRAIIKKCSHLHGLSMELRESGQLGQKPQRAQPPNDPGILSPEPLFGFAYDFSSPNSALLHIMFWSNLIFLQSLIERTTLLIRLHAGVPLSKDLESTPAHPEKHADDLARSIFYCLQDCMKLSLGKAATYALCVSAIRYLTTGNSEKHK